MRVNGFDMSISQENHREMLWNPDFAQKMLKRLRSSVCFTFFNSSFAFSGDTHALDDFPKGSVMWELERLF